MAFVLRSFTLQMQSSCRTNAASNLLGQNNTLKSRVPARTFELIKQNYASLRHVNCVCAVKTQQPVLHESGDAKLDGAELDFEYTVMAFKRPKLKTKQGRRPGKEQPSYIQYAVSRGAAAPAVMALMTALEDTEAEKPKEPDFVVELDNIIFDHKRHSSSACSVTRRSAPPAPNPTHGQGRCTVMQHGDGAALTSCHPQSAALVKPIPPRLHQTPPFDLPRNPASQQQQQQMRASQSETTNQLRLRHPHGSASSTHTHTQQPRAIHSTGPSADTKPASAPLACTVQQHIEACGRQLRVHPRKLARLPILRSVLLHINNSSDVGVRFQQFCALTNLSRARALQLLQAHPYVLLLTPAQTQERAAAVAQLFTGDPSAPASAAMPYLRAAPELLTARYHPQTAMLAVARALAPALGMEGVLHLLTTCPGVLTHPHAGLKQASPYSAVLLELAACLCCSTADIARGLVAARPTILLRSRGALRSCCSTVVSQFGLHPVQLRQVLEAEPDLLLDSPGKIEVSLQPGGTTVRRPNFPERVQEWRVSLAWEHHCSVPCCWLP